MLAQATHELQWQKSTYSGNSGQCIEISIGHGDRVLVRDSKCPHRSRIMVNAAVWCSFVGAVKAGPEGDFRFPVMDTMLRLEYVSGIGAR
ncbi:DUF397 domain-containing protein [Streptomyces sp. NPDC021100]|uniref:DUF397 domain-containing protein n=1 Tax=Streptomyces sp. NPDC021100 TaxID=3365114 RepID=UPI003794B8EC